VSALHSHFFNKSLTTSRETVSLENTNAFFPFLDLITNPDLNLPPPHIIHPNAALELAVSNNLLPEHGALEFVELNMGLRAATPKIEAFYQYYEDQFNSSRGELCGSWVDWYGEVVCDVDRLTQLIDEPS
jgi:UDP-glucose:glycoprotein glucosyltransferase